VWSALGVTILAVDLLGDGVRDPRTRHERR
jgi:hypothetical protein